MTPIINNPSLAKKIIIISITIAVGLYFFNLLYVSGPTTFFDCRVTTAAASDGYVLCDLSRGGCTAAGVPRYPVSTICPVDKPATVDECKELYAVYSSFETDPVGYRTYEDARCMGVTSSLEFDSEEERCQHMYEMIRPPEDRPSIKRIPYEKYKERYCGL